MKNTKHLIALQALTLSGIANASENASGNKPMNILCIVCEDTSTPYFGCYGGKLAVTPTIDNLAKEGVRYTNFYDVIGVSAPSRVALITGLYPTAIGANNMRTWGSAPENYPEGVPPYEFVPPAGVKCYPEYLRAAGYYCTNNAKTDYQFIPPLTAWDECNGRAHWKNAPEGMPFFAIFNIEVSHESYVWVNRNKPLTVDPKDVPVPPYFPDTDTVRRDIARVYSNLRLADQQIEQRINELKDAGKLDNTIIIFYSDNGGPLLRQKRTVYEAGIHVPLIIRYPDGKGAGTVNDRICSFVDIPATIMSLLNIRPPAYMHGKAFTGKYEATPREYAFAAQDRCDVYYDKVGSVRDKHFLFVRNYMPEIAGYLDAGYRRQMPLMMDILKERDSGRLNKIQMDYFIAPRPVEEFYDVDNDPHTINNLINDQRYQTDIDRLRKAHNQWVQEYNDLWFLSEKELREYMMPGGVQKVVGAPVVVRSKDEVSIFCATEGASIAYKVNGKGFTPQHWMLYTKPVTLKKGDTIEAIAVRAGFKPSITVNIEF